MKKLFTLIFLLCLLSLTSRASVIVFSLRDWNLSGTQAFTNSIRITQVRGPFSDGSFVNAGLPILLSTTNGLYTNSFAAGVYSLVIVNGAKFPYAQPLYFTSFDDGVAYPFLSNQIAGGNFFLTQPGPAGAAGPPGAGVASVTQGNGIQSITNTSTNLTLQIDPFVVPQLTQTNGFTGASNTFTGPVRVGNFNAPQTSLNADGSASFASGSVTVSSAGALAGKTFQSGQVTNSIDQKLTGSTAFYPVSGGATPSSTIDGFGNAAFQGSFAVGAAGTFGFPAAATLGSGGAGSGVVGGASGAFGVDSGGNVRIANPNSPGTPLTLNNDGSAKFAANAATIDASGNITGLSFTGSASGLTGLPLVNLATGVTGTLADGSLSANIDKLNGNQTITGTKTLNNTVTFTSGITNYGNWLWNASVGSWGNAGDPNLIIRDEPGHADRPEFEIIADQIGIGLVNHAQLGASSIVTNQQAYVLNWTGVDGDHYNKSDILGFHVLQHTGSAFPQIWAESYDTASGGYQINVTGSDGGGNQDWNQTEGVPLLQIDQDTGVRVPGYMAVGYALNSASGTNCAINMTNQDTVEFDVSQNVNLFVTNLNIFGHITNTVVQHKRILIFPGQGNWTLTTPTNWAAPGVGLGVATNTMPTALTNSMICQIDLLFTLGSSTTNVLPTLTYYPYSPAFDANAAALIGVMGLSSATEKIALNQLVLDFKAAGVWTGCFDYGHTYLGSSSNSCKWNIFDTNHFNYIFNGTSGTLTFDAQGGSGDGSTSYGDSQFNPSTASSPHYTQNSAFLMVYSRYNPGYNGGIGQAQIGAGFNGGSVGASWWSEAGTGTNATGIIFRGLNDNSFGTISYGNGFQFINRTASTTSVNVSGGVSGNNATATTGLPNQNFYVFANNDGGANRFSTNRIALDLCGRGLNSTELPAVSNACVRFLGTLSRL